MSVIFVWHPAGGRWGCGDAQLPALAAGREGGSLLATVRAWGPPDWACGYAPEGPPAVPLPPIFCLPLTITNLAGEFINATPDKL